MHGLIITFKQLVVLRSLLTLTIIISIKWIYLFVSILRLTRKKVWSFLAIYDQATSKIFVKWKHCSRIIVSNFITNFHALLNYKFIVVISSSQTHIFNYQKLGKWSPLISILIFLKLVWRDSTHIFYSIIYSHINCKMRWSSIYQYYLYLRKY